MGESSSESRPVRHRVVYHGRVQGVGFRYTTLSVAKRYAVDGYVKNLSNGTVEMVAEGTESVLQAFQAKISSTFEKNIDGADCVQLPAEGMCSGFEIRT